MRPILPLVLLALAVPAHADLRDFCASRPGLGTPACTIDPGHVQVEVGVADWRVVRAGTTRTDTLAAGEVTAHIGLDATTEAQIGWTAYGHVRSIDRESDQTDRSASTGDVVLGLRRSVSGPNGPIAVQPFVTLPTGGAAAGAGDWGAGVVVPIGFDLGHGIGLALTPQAAAAVNQSRSGRHFAFGSVVGLSVPLAKTIGGTVEFAATRDLDPSVHSTAAVASTSLAWQAGKNTQFDVGTVVGLNANSAQLYLGISRRF